jgi:hypothetical protein
VVRWAFALSLFLVACGGEPAPEREPEPDPPEGSRAYEGHLPGTQPENVAVALVRDLRTGAPLAGVRVAQYKEDASDTMRSAPLLAETKTDEFGLARVAWQEEPYDCHWVFDKPGWAVTEQYGQFPKGVVELKRGRDVEAWLLGPDGKPRAGVEVEAFLGCGHSPAVRRVTTDAEGRFVLSDVDPPYVKLWFVTHDLKSEYWELLDGDRVLNNVFRAYPGVTVTGKIVDRNGKPVAGGMVRSCQEQRGPKTLTGADGTFRLEGFDPSDVLNAYGPQGDGFAGTGRHEIEHSVPVLLMLRDRMARDNSGRVDPDVEDVKLRIVAVDADSGEEVPALEVALLRALDGRVFFADDGELEAPPGRYVLRAGGPLESHAAGPQPFEVRAGDTDVHRIPVRRQPRLEVVAHGLPKEDASVAIVPPDLVKPLSHREGYRCRLAADARVTLRVEAQGLVRILPIGPAQAGARRVEFRWPQPKRVRVAFEGAYTYHLREVWHERQGDVIHTHASGRQTLVVADDGLGEQEIAVEVPAEPGAEVVIPSDALRPPGELQVVLPDGKRLVDASADVRFGRLHHERVRINEEGKARSWCLRRGAHVLVEQEGLAPLRRTLRDDGPHVVRWGTAGLDLRLAEPTPFVLCLDGDLLKGGKDGTLSLRGLDAGPHTLIIAATGRQSRALRVALRDNERYRYGLPIR